MARAPRHFCRSAYRRSYKNVYFGGRSNIIGRLLMRRRHLSRPARSLKKPDPFVINKGKSAAEKACLLRQTMMVLITLKNGKQYQERCPHCRGLHIYDWKGRESSAETERFVCPDCGCK